MEHECAIGLWCECDYVDCISLSELKEQQRDNMEFDIDNKKSFIVIDDFLIFPMDNWEELHEIYKFGKTDGQLCLKYSIENLLKRY